MFLSSCSLLCLGTLSESCQLSFYSPLLFFFYGILIIVLVARAAEELNDSYYQTPAQSATLVVLRPSFVVIIASLC